MQFAAETSTKAAAKFVEFKELLCKMKLLQLYSKGGIFMNKVSPEGKGYSNLNSSVYPYSRLAFLTLMQS